MPKFDAWSDLDHLIHASPSPRFRDFLAAYATRTL